MFWGDISAPAAFINYANPLNPTAGQKRYSVSKQHHIANGGNGKKMALVSSRKVRREKTTSGFMLVLHECSVGTFASYSKMITKDIYEH